MLALMCTGRYNSSMNESSKLREVLQKVSEGLLSPEVAEKMLDAERRNELEVFRFTATARLEVRGEIQALDEENALMILVSPEGTKLVRQNGEPQLEVDTIKIERLEPDHLTKRLRRK